MKAVLINIANSCLLSKLNKTAQIKNSGSKYWGILSTHVKITKSNVLSDPSEKILCLV
jgi:hypothetical protein